MTKTPLPYNLVTLYSLFKELNAAHRLRPHCKPISGYIARHILGTPENVYPSPHRGDDDIVVVVVFVFPASSYSYLCAFVWTKYHPTNKILFALRKYMYQNIYNWAAYAAYKSIYLSHNVFMYKKILKLVGGIYFSTYINYSNPIKCKPLPLYNILLCSLSRCVCCERSR